MYYVQDYLTPEGRDPFKDWLASLSDRMAQARVAARVQRLATGNFGDCKPLADGVWELRIDHDPGYRVYYARAGERMILLLVGGDKRRLRLATLFQMTFPGAPSVYYGDEIGMTGANDPDNRRMMRFSGLSPEEASVKQTVTKLGNLRKNSMPLIYGSTKVLQASKDQLVYIRSYFGKSVVVALNRSASAVNLDVTLPAGTATKSAEAFNQSKTSVKDNKLSMTVQPLSFEIITLQ